jgi:hypothetical protein
MSNKDNLETPNVDGHSRRPIRHRQALTPWRVQHVAHATARQHRVTRYGLCHRLDTGPPRHIATLGMLATGVTDAGLAEFWARALRKLRKLRFDGQQRRDTARQMLRRGAPLPQEATWPGSTEGAWAEILAELAALMRDQELVV